MTKPMLMSKQEIVRVLELLQVHPAPSVEQLDAPTPEVVTATYQSLVEFAYDVDLALLKQHMAEFAQDIAPFDGTLELCAINCFVRQLAALNGNMDVGFKDIWEPSAKRTRVVLSGLINFCRFKESQSQVYYELTDEATKLENHRVELLQASQESRHELGALQDERDAALPQVRVAEQEAQEAQAQLDRVQKERRQADRRVEDASAQVAASQERIAEARETNEALRAQIADLKGQVAESPEGLRQDIQDIQHVIGQYKARREEKISQKRTHLARNQVLDGLKHRIQSYSESLENNHSFACRVGRAHGDVVEAEEDLRRMRNTLAQRSAATEHAEKEIQQVTEEIERAKEERARRVEDLEHRRQLALERQQEVQERFDDEQRQAAFWQGQWAELQEQLECLQQQHRKKMAELQQAASHQVQQAWADIEALKAHMEARTEDGGCVGGAPMTPCRAPPLTPRRVVAA